MCPTFAGRNCTSPNPKRNTNKVVHVHISVRTITPYEYKILNKIIIFIVVINIIFSSLSSAFTQWLPSSGELTCMVGINMGFFTLYVSPVKMEPEALACLANTLRVNGLSEPNILSIQRKLANLLMHYFLVTNKGSVSRNTMWNSSFMAFLLCIKVQQAIRRQLLRLY